MTIQTKRTCLLVLGMHRSGTSALVRVLSMLGAALPKVVLGSGPGNEEGHWEPGRIVALHDRMLADAASSWDDWRCIDLLERLGPKLEDYKAELGVLLQDEYGNEPLFVLKDPRICRFVPLYRTLFESLKIDLKPVLVYRHPLEVATSLQQRNHLSVATAQVQWLRHVLDAERDTKDLPRAIVAYDRLMRDWRSEIKRTSEDLGLVFPNSIEQVSTDIDAFLQPKHRHHTVCEDRTEGYGGLGACVDRTYTALAHLSADPKDSRQVFDDVNRELQAAADVLGAALVDEQKLKNKAESNFRSAIDQASQLAIFEAKKSHDFDVCYQLLKDERDRGGAEIKRLETKIERVQSMQAEWALEAKRYPPMKDASDIPTDQAAVEAALDKCLMIIPSINGAVLLQRMLPSLKLSGKQIVVLDQGSVDTTAEVCRGEGVELIQLGRPHTYTEACNIGLKIAVERCCDYILVANNDIEFKTDVARELMTAMLADPGLAIVAPSQLLIDEEAGHRMLAYRVFWHLALMQFEHDFAVPPGNPKRIESDFCELTLALVRIAVTEKIGFLDDAYGFYFEDADFGYRARQAGYSCAYLPGSQISHYSSSTVKRTAPDWKINKLQANKILFAKKHLGYGMSHFNHGSTEANSWNVINVHLNKYLLKYGLVDQSKPELIFSHPGARPFDYLYTVWETTKLPEAWLAHRNSYKVLIAASHWNADIFRAEKFSNVHHASLGVETDIFHPWGDKERLFNGLTFLWFSTNQHRKGLDVMLAAWEPFHAARPGARLVLMGRNIDFPGAPERDFIWKNFRVSEYLVRGIAIYEAIAPISDDELAQIYRGVDFAINTSRSEGFGFTVVEAMACGTPAIFGNYGATAEFVFPGALVFDGIRVKANYQDKGFTDVGDWFEPDKAGILACLNTASDMTNDVYALLARTGMLLVRNKFTWHQTVFAIRSAIATVQVRQPITLASPSLDYSGSSLSTLKSHPKVADRPVRLLVIRNMRRVSKFLSSTTDAFEHQGGRAALRLAASLLREYALSRMRNFKTALKTRSSMLAPRNRPNDLPLKSGPLFIGYVEASLGLAEVLRNMVSAVAKQTEAFAVYPFNVAVEQRRIGPFMAQKYEFNHPHKINVIYVAADQVQVVFANVPKSLHERSYNILRTYWELPSAPAAWRPMLQGIDEIWAPNDFVRRAFASVFDGPINIIPPCVDVDAESMPDRTMLGLVSGRFYYLFSFDFYSSPYRKNPLAVIEAFQKAFGGRSDNVGLIIKSIGAEGHHPGIRAKFQEAADLDPRILIMSKTLSRPQMLGLIKASDCYVSLHRAEGFGAGMVEAMSFGNAVIGTGFSGCSDFMKVEYSYPVPYKLRNVEPHEYVWSEEQQWAEPDVDAAADLFRQVYEDPVTRARKTTAAKAFVDRLYSPAAVAAAVLNRVSEIERKLG